MQLSRLVNIILSVGPHHLSTERRACRLLVRTRWPCGIRCPRCNARCRRALTHVQCNGPAAHRFTIFVGTPFERSPCVRARALFLGVHYLSSVHRSISARGLARDVGMDHVTLWRHLHILRSLMPKPPVRPSSQNCKVLLTGRYTRAQRSWARLAGPFIIERELSGTPPSTQEPRLLGETVRTWLNGTFHGVTARWLPNYLREIAGRWWRPPDQVARHLLRLLIGRGPSPRFRERPPAAVIIGA